MVYYSLVFSHPGMQDSNFLFFHVNFSRNACIRIQKRVIDDQAEELHWLALSNPFLP